LEYLDLFSKNILASFLLICKFLKEYFDRPKQPRMTLTAVFQCGAISLCVYKLLCYATLLITPSARQEKAMDTSNGDEQSQQVSG